MNGVIDPSHQRAAKVAGATILLSMSLLIYGNFAVFQPLLVPDDPGATASNILAHPYAYRSYAVVVALHALANVIILSAFYVVLRPIGPGLSFFAASSRFVFALAWVLVAVRTLSALRIAAGPKYMEAFSPEELHALVRLEIAGGHEIYYTGLLFWSVASTAAAWLWLKSSYVPRWLAVFGILASAWGVVTTAIFIIHPGFREVVNWWWYDSPLGGFEAILAVVLLFRGLRSRP